MAEEPIRMMVITAHPDDSEFMCGGSVAKWTAEGREVYYVISTNGNKGTGDPEMTSERLAGIREREQRAAASVLGVKDVIFLGYGDGELEDTKEYRGKLVRAIRQYRPNIVVTMDPYRHSHNHRDHRMAGTVTLDACYPYARDHLHYPEHILEGLSTHKVSEVYLAGTEQPNLWVDVSDTIDLKVKALQCHVSQVGERPSEEFLSRMREAAARTGEGASVPLAEAFRRIPFRG